MLSTIQAPVMTIFGKDSWYAQVPDLDQRLKALSQLQKNEVMNCGHSPHIEVPEALSTLLCHQIPDLLT